MTKKQKSKEDRIPAAIEIHNDFIKVAAIIRSGKDESFLLIKKEFFSKDPESIFKEIAALSKTHRFLSDKIYLNMPRHQVMVRLMHLPSTDDGEIADMVKMESTRQMPYRDEKIVVGYKIAEKTQDGYSDVLIAVIEATAVERIINILKGSGIVPGKIALSSESLLAWYLTVKGKTRDADKAAGNVAVINVSSSYVDLDILEKDKLVFTRAFSCGAGDLYAVEDVVREIEASITTCKKEIKLNLDKLVLTGAESRVIALEAVLKNSVGIPIETVPQDGGFKISAKSTADLTADSFAGLIGLCLKAKDMDINLLPVGMIEKNELKIIKKSLSNTLALFLGIAILFLGITGKIMLNRIRQLEDINAKISSMEPTVLKARKMKEDIKIIKSTVMKKPLAVDLLSEIYKITPEGIVFDMIDYESDKFLILRGSAGSLDSVIQYIKALETSDYFESVKMKYTAERFSSGKSSTDFEIVCELSNVE